MLLIRAGAGLLLASSLAGCSFSFSAGGPDYEKLQQGIADELNSTYSSIDQEVTAVDCPKQSELKTGDTFICTADLDGQDVRVEVTATDDDGNVNFSTLDIVYDQDITEDRGFDVTVDCGDGIEVVAIGESFECTAADRRGDTRQVQVTAGDVGEGDSWEIIEE